MIITSETLALATWTFPYRGRHWEDEVNKRENPEADVMMMDKNPKNFILSFS